jgi:hypothetical protein
VAPSARWHNWLELDTHHERLHCKTSGFMEYSFTGERADSSNKTSRGTLKREDEPEE